MIAQAISTVHTCSSHPTSARHRRVPSVALAALSGTRSIFLERRSHEGHRCRLSRKLVGQLIIPVPASLPQANHELASQLGGSVHALHDGSDDALASQLQRDIVGADAAEQLDDSRSVTPVYRRPQGGALLL